MGSYDIELHHFPDTSISCLSTPKTLRPRTSNDPLLKRRKESDNRITRGVINDPDFCNSAPITSSGTRGQEVTSEALLQPNIRYDPEVVGPDNSTVPTCSVHLQQQMKMADKQVIDQLMASIQIRPISGGIKFETKTMADRRWVQETLVKGSSWPCIRMSSATSQSNKAMRRAGWWRSKGKYKVTGEGDTALDHEEEETTEGEAATVGSPVVTIPATIFAEKLILSPKPQRSAKLYANKTHSYDLQRSGGTRHELPMCQIGLLEKRGRSSILRTPKAQSLSPYLPNYHPESPFNSSGRDSDNRPYSSVESGCKKVTFSDKRCASSSDAIRPWNKAPTNETLFRKLHASTTGLSRPESRRQKQSEKKSTGKSRQDKNKRAQGMATSIYAIYLHCVIIGTH